ncbi:glycosyltransferase family 2 protein [Agromyces sp. SYSU K20354]|uniref:glycosyltransferase n=1 Tax=Agromyces cavernae TaxID=2898659 RepID=UPI001E467576|nr:glycosyltransferase [Agromyces cavernae]MCD2444066.1 glycosyltransferase family 2 protein [Agromyces cavernae]
MSRPFVDVVIACHDASRPIERAVASVLHDDDVRDEVRVTVVAHGLGADAFEQRLAGIDGSWRVVSFTDGVRSAAGPFNHGLELVEGDYCAVMGSDDFLEPGAMSAWVRHVRAERPAAAIARIRLQGEAVMPNPLVRLGRIRRVDAAKDRLFYRTAPLGLIETAEMHRLDLRMTEGVRVGEDFDFGIRLWSVGRRVDFLGAAPCYVIGVDARERTTYAPLTVEQFLEPVTRLLDDGLPAELTPAHRRALAIKLVRISILGAAGTRRDADAWRGDDEVEFLAAALRRLLALAPGVLAVFNLKDRRVLDGLLAEPTVARVTADVLASSRAGRRARWLTKNPLRSFGRESTLRRYMLYYLKRERKVSPS